MPVAIISLEVVGAHFCDLGLGGQYFIKRKYVIRIRIFGIFHRGTVRLDAHDLLAQLFVGLEKTDEVSLALAHLIPIGAGDIHGIFLYLAVWQDKSLP